MTRGVISRTNNWWSFTPGGHQEYALRFDAQIHGGNSGGLLLSKRTGKLIGVPGVIMIMAMQLDGVSPYPQTWPGRS